MTQSYCCGRMFNLLLNVRISWFFFTTELVREKKKLEKLRCRSRSVRTSFKKYTNQNHRERERNKTLLFWTVLKLLEI